MTRTAAMAISLAFLGAAYLAGYLSHSTTVFVTIVAIGLVVRVVLRRAR